ncbi:MAG: FAD-dependent oxidoreductase [Ruminococcaceae bacterium]|nr:FAD-dependent oxidoreductase [Oscillospiraceae bacterium]
MSVKNFDTVIIGGGIGGLMAAYRLNLNDPSMKIAVTERGNTLEKRSCPAGKNKTCVHCKICSITSGFAGAGAFSDGKFNLGTAYGGTLGEELGDDTANHYIDEVDDILTEYCTSGEPQVYKSNDELKLKCLQNNLRLLDMNVKHLGTDNNYLTMQNLIDNIEQKGIELYPFYDCVSVEKSGNGYILNFANGERFFTKNIIIATGRSGANFVADFCRSFDIPMRSNHIDIGVRVEMKDIIWREFSDRIYEPKILYKTKTFEDRCRMFCFNKGGLVSAENNHGIITANGHSFAQAEKKTDNCNFAILSSIRFTEPFNQPTEYAESISRLANMIGKGSVIVQRFGDLVRGRRTNDHRLSQNTVIPTLKATAGDISLVLPHRILTNIIETIYALDKVAPGTANDDTLLYGCESKYYSIRPIFKNKKFELVDNVYIIGDGSGICRGLSQSGAMGIYVADCISGKIDGQ